MIRAIFLDLGKVIIDFDYHRSIQYLMSVSPVALPDIVALLNDQALVVEYETGRITTAAFHRRVCNALMMECTLEEFKQIWGAMFLPTPLISDSLLAALKGRYPLLLLSNTNELHYGYVVENYPILRHFDRRVLSYEVGAMKPDGRIYELALNEINVPAEEIFFADDRAENVKAACACGIKAVQFQSEEQLCKEMQQHGILF